MRFAVLETRAVALLRTKIRNGEITERGLARMAGISQSHVHNVLSGARGLSWEVADQVFGSLGLSVLDLLEPDDWRAGPKDLPARAVEPG
jgi:transcriptional regulator with XRE-family HTH domain